MITLHQKKLAAERQIRYRQNPKNKEKIRVRDLLSKRKIRKSKPEHFREYDRNYRKNNPEKFKQYYLNRKEKMKIYVRNKLLSKYGLTQETFNQKLILQEGRCAICKSEFKKDRLSRIAIDHCHETGKTRDLLCDQCNLFLGYVEKLQKQNKNILERFTEYLKIHSNKMEEALKD